VVRAPLPAGSLVIADLHLDVDRPAEHALFLRFLKAAEDAPALVILGDLFEYWLGPSHVPNARPLLEALRAFPGDVWLIPGNRDVLVGSEVAAFGVQLAMDGLRVQGPTGSADLLLLHGDELCVKDRSYQRLRRILRRRSLRAVLRGLPAPVARRLARRLRNTSKSAVSAKAPLTVRQDRAEAARRLTQTGAHTLVVGHAHAFVDETIELDAATPGRFCVLDAFDPQHQTQREVRDLMTLAWAPQSGAPILDFRSVRDFCAETEASAR
jgi:UDP-2,3-diacylglucosamine hydrolase